jgi:hypothetical protein
MSRSKRVRVRAVITAAAAAAALAGASAASAQFATTVVQSAGLPNTGLYDSADAVLGKPTTSFADPTGPVFHASPVVGAFNTTPPPNPQKTVTTIGPGVDLIVAFDKPVLNDPANPYGVDLLVFGNSFFSHEGFLAPDSNMEQQTIGDNLFAEQTVLVSVAQNAGGPWFTFSRKGDALFPTEGYAWDRITHAWGAESDFTKPVNPNLTAADFTGKSVADGIDLYAGSGGGTGFDLSEVGLASAQYVRFQYDGSGLEPGEIDAVSDVSPAPEPASGALIVVAGSVIASRRRRRNGWGAR